MTINLQLPARNEILKPTITVIGVGGAGGNAVNNMISSNLEGVNFVVANTDAQALDNSLATRTVQLGAGITRGLGAGANPDVGRAAAEEAMDEIAGHIEGSNMIFITGGMGGGTGTGAAPVVARIAREQGILTVAVVTKPFQFEGSHRMKLAEAGLKELQEYVDTLIIIPNQNLFRIANERTTFADAFRLADEVLHSGVRGVTDLIVKPGTINLDFADIRTVMREMGKAMMGTGEASGERRAVEAADAAISNPLLDDVSLKGAKAALINITGGMDISLFEVDEVGNRIREQLDPDANIIVGAAFNDGMEGRIRVSVIATGIDQSANQQQRTPSNPIEQKKPYLFNNVSRPEPVRSTARPAAFEAPRPSQPASTPAEAAERVVSNLVPASRLIPESRPVFGRLMESPAPAAASAAAVAVAEPRVAERAEQSPAVEKEPASEDASRSLFQRIADVSRSLAPRHEPEVRAAMPERQMQVTEKPRPEMAKPTSSSQEEEQFLQIPAFLRRQAN